MERIGVRELRQHASRWLARVAGGESFEVTDRGRPVARLVPVRDGGVLERLVREGRAVPAKGDVLEVEPLPATGFSPSAELARMREHKRIVADVGDERRR